MEEHALKAWILIQCDSTKEVNIGRTNDDHNKKGLHAIFLAEFEGGL